MTLPFRLPVYERYAPLLGRVLLGGLFLMGGAFKIPGTGGYAMETAMTAAAGVPFAHVAVFLAFILEVCGGIALIIGWHARHAAFLLGLFTALLVLIFHFDFSSPEAIGQFVSHMGLIGGLLYVSVYGAQTVAVRKDLPPLVR